MSNRKKALRKLFYNNFIMPKDIKTNIIAKNLHRLAQLEQALFIFGVIMCIATIVRYNKDFKQHIPAFCYYLAYIFTSIHVLIAAIRTVKHPEWPVWKKNKPTYIAIFELLLLCAILQYFGANVITVYTIYTNICIITIVMLAVEPIFLISILTFFSIIIIKSLYQSENFFMLTNILLTTIIMTGLSLYKWNNLITQFKLEKNRDLQLHAMEKEINLAAFVQESFTKKKLPELKGFQVSYYSKAMSGVSGDMYDFYTNGPELKGVGVFDVSGHGIASGLVTMLVRNIIQQEFHQNYDKPLNEVMEIIDARIKKEKRDIENYLTGVLIRTKGHRVEIVNAGHPSPILFKRSQNKCIFFDEERKYASSAIGLTSFNIEFKSTKFTMEKDDELILYTDGVKEALNSDNKEYGDQRFIYSVQKAMTQDFPSQLGMILSDMGMFTENASQNDDITIVILKKK